MPPIANTDPTLLPSDDEDEDFVASDSGDSSSDSEDDHPSKRPKVAETPIEPAMSKDAVEDLWASFNAPEEVVASTSKAAAPKPKKVTITVSYEFVGETITTEKEVLEDSEEARVWREAQAFEGKGTTVPPKTVDSKGKGPAAPSAEDALFGPADASTAAPRPLPPAVAAPPPKLAPPKRAKGGLSALSASLSKPPKLNTLEKSKLDWNKFVTKEELSDDLNKARKDGYLEKQDFLQRTEDRREEDYDKSKRGRR